MPDVPAAAMRAPTRVLVVDDSAALVTSIRQFLSAQPDVAVVATALGGRDAIEMCRRHQPDLVLMDVHMPDADGLSAAAIIRREFASVRIILTSIDKGVELRATCLKHAADSFLPKIGLPRNLMAEIRRLRPPAAPTIAAPLGGVACLDGRPPTPSAENSGSNHHGRATQSVA